MSKFARLTGHGVAAAIKPEAIEEAELLGLPTDRAQLAAVYKAVAGIVDGYSREDTRNFALHSRVKDGKIKPISVCGADGALAVVGILLGQREPSSIIKAVNTKIYDRTYNNDASGVLQLRSINEPFIVRPVQDEPYLRGFMTVLNLAAHRLDGKIGLTEVSYVDLQTAAREEHPQILAASHDTRRALLYCGLKGMTNEYPELITITREFNEPVLSMVIAEQNFDGYYVSHDPGNDALGSADI